MNKPLKIYFLGSGEIGLPVLRKIANVPEIELVGVGSQPDRPGKRGKTLVPTPITQEAAALGYEADRPASVNDPDYLAKLRNLAPDMILVIAYGQLLKAEVLALPRFGCINVHASLLPKYRGASPIQSVILAGEKETGVNIMYMAEGLDTGDIISVEKFPILPEDDFEAIHDRSAEVGSKILSETIEKIYLGEAERIQQDDSLACYASKVEKEDCKIDFTLSAEKLDCIIRGVTPIPGAFCYHNGKMLKINKATPVSDKGTPGKVIDLSAKGEGYITVACGEGSLKITTLIPEGKGKMTAGDFVRGRKIDLGDILE